MKNKILIAIISPLFLFSCGDDNADVTANDSSSLIAVENPTQVAEVEKTDVKVNDVVSDLTTSIEFFESEHHFGNVFYPSENLYTFKFKNTGNEPLVIESATASCGCTIPNKPEDPILPGEVGELDVIFKPKQGQVGSLVTKKITVIANTEPKETYLNIKGDVQKEM